MLCQFFGSDANKLIAGVSKRTHAYVPIYREQNLVFKHSRSMHMCSVILLYVMPNYLHFNTPRQDKISLI